MHQIELDQVAPGAVIMINNGYLNEGCREISGDAGMMTEWGTHASVNGSITRPIESFTRLPARPDG